MEAQKQIYCLEKNDLKKKSNLKTWFFCADFFFFFFNENIKKENFMIIY